MKIKNYKQFTENIKDQSAKQRISLNKIREDLGLKRATFYRNLNGEGCFSLEDSILLAKALNLDFSLNKE